MLCRCGNAFCYSSQRYTGPKVDGQSLPGLRSASKPSVPDRVVNAYSLEEQPCEHHWRGCNRKLDKLRICHLCQKSKRCFQNACTKCHLRACTVCKSQLK
jgi:hypothetical protein